MSEFYSTAEGSDKLSELKSLPGRQTPPLSGTKFLFFPSPSMMIFLGNFSFLGPLFQYMTANVGTQVSPQSLIIPVGWLQAYNSLLGLNPCSDAYGPGDHRPVTYQESISWKTSDLPGCLF